MGLITFAWFDPPGSGLGVLGTLCLLALTRSALGQSISALAKSEETAIAIVPIAVIPQIILGGVVGSLSGASEWFGKILAIIFWGQYLLSGRLPKTERAVTEFQPSDAACLMVIAFHMTVFLVAAWIGVRRAGRH
ncbi:ABC transporter permease [Novipirellula galeiformis]|uniref:ABC transporter permease n=1 Tax=Novipirellula galeiformis TaxID=2528004 RepID=UPI0036F2247C